MRESNVKRRANKVKKVDIHATEKLLEIQRKRNEELEGTKYTCTLHPKTSEPCASCPEEYSRFCKHHEWERDYIHKHDDSNKDSKRREKKEGKAKRKQEITESHVKQESTYICTPYEFACPLKGKCSKGKDCPWK